MRFKVPILVAFAGGFLVMSHPAIAHHGSAGYDNTKMTIVKATITAWVFRNPHSELRFDVTEASGEVKHWAIEAPPTVMLVERGWNNRSLKAGDAVTIHFNAARNGALAGILRKVVMPNGEDLWAYPPPELIEKLTTQPR